MTTLSPYQTYRAMYNFMCELYDLMDNDTLGAVLESLRIKRETGLPVNRNLRNDWDKLVARTGLESFGARDAWDLMEEFLRGIGQALDNLQMDKVISYVSLRENDKETQATWQEMVEIAAGEETDWPSPKE